ncbi:MAG: NAD(P)H-quinone oxidoreductase subunit 4 [Limnothrix sp.]|nr:MULTISPECIES: NAD(P)H-quinone oxidoreductase subunit 4 [unclassified Limnothrix]MBD2161655.1 NAD(P)H-quinone oxidoreductase subunit 4 [Limnothrix sp. FACHB-1083]MBD2192368.1 NAD(P)H-quinone oxidoreductase subunit 4 [Limnothrix sp. FACHB-1088]MBD2635097.1 NAD(P)H-quinone oxidoreductase subunit 4 [Limnothrix sp. FACHB-881]MEB3116996.1 NAD(P)H-quinone oxidoreductase subunit 4 [Limnothrix sp.]
MADHFPWLTAIILFPLIAAFLIPLLPDRNGKTVRWFALSVGVLDFLLMVYTFWTHYDSSNSSFQLVEKYPWLPQIGFSWAVSVDGISMPLVLLAGFVTTLAMWASWQVDRKPRLFYFLMLVLYAAQIGVFVAQDLLLLFIQWELELVPVYLLVSIWGGQKRRYAATKFLIYTAAASIFILVAGLALALSGDGPVTFDIADLALKNYSLGLELLLYAGLLIAFGVKLAIFPMHTWLPDAHGEASAPVSMILAGVLLKMGGYGLIRLNLELLSDAHIYFAPVLAILGVVNIIYGAFASFAQTNMKRRLAYSSVSHMGFVLLGIASFTDLGVSGAMLQMLSHGLIAALLFFLAGVTYDRTHTLAMDQMRGMGQLMPKVFALFTAGALASLALPGMSGFASELAVFVGFTSSDIYSSTFCTVTVFLAAVGVILTPIYLLSMLRQVFYGTSADLACEVGNAGLQNQDVEGAVCFGTDCVLPDQAVFRDARKREVAISMAFLIPIVAIGVYPQLATKVYDVKTVAVNSQVRESYTIAKANPEFFAQGLFQRSIAQKVAQAPTLAE